MRYYYRKKAFDKIENISRICFIKV